MPDSADICVWLFTQVEQAETRAAMLGGMVEVAERAVTFYDQEARNLQKVIQTQEARLRWMITHGYLRVDDGYLVLVQPTTYEEWCAAIDEAMKEGQKDD
jgi:hypothetical protein